MTRRREFVPDLYAVAVPLVNPRQHFVSVGNADERPCCVAASYSFTRLWPDWPRRDATAHQKCLQSKFNRMECQDVLPSQVRKALVEVHCPFQTFAGADSQRLGLDLQALMDQGRKAEVVSRLMRLRERLSCGGRLVGQRSSATALVGVRFHRLQATRYMLSGRQWPRVYLPPHGALSDVALPKHKLPRRRAKIPRRAPTVLQKSPSYLDREGKHGSHL